MRKIKQCFFFTKKEKEEACAYHKVPSIRSFGRSWLAKRPYAFVCTIVCVLLNNCVHFNIRGITAGTLCPNPIFKNCHLSVHFCVGIETVLRILSTTNFRQTNCHLSRCF